MYGCESWHLQNKEQNRISVAWNNCFRSIFNCCWRESVNPLHFLQSIAYKLLDSSTTTSVLEQAVHFTSDNSVLFTLSRLVSQRFAAVGYMYGLSSIRVSRQTIKQAVCGTFSSTAD